jgi:hypothetical protein
VDRLGRGRPGGDEIGKRMGTGATGLKPWNAMGKVLTLQVASICRQDGDDIPMNS